jgi:hypothetical protein
MVPIDPSILANPATLPPYRLYITSHACLVPIRTCRITPNQVIRPRRVLSLCSLQKRYISCFLQFGLELPRVCWVNSPKMLAHTSPRACVCPVTSLSKQTELWCATVCQERQMGQAQPVKVGRMPKIAGVPAFRCRFDRSCPPRRTSELGAMKFRFRHMEDSATGTPHLRNRTTNHVGSMQPVCPKHRTEIAGCRIPEPCRHLSRPACCAIPHPSQSRLECWVVPRGLGGTPWSPFCSKSSQAELSDPSVVAQTNLEFGTCLEVLGTTSITYIVYQLNHRPTLADGQDHFKRRCNVNQGASKGLHNSKEMGSLAVAACCTSGCLICQASSSLLHHSRVR